MRLRLIINEIAKMKRRHIGLVASILILSVAGMSLMGAASGGTDILTWQALLAGTSLAFPMTCPLLIAVIASRIVDMEHEGNGWLAGLSGGIGTGQVCRAKMVAAGLVVTLTTIVASALLVTLGTLLGTDSLPVELWVGHTCAILSINLVVLGAHILLSARVENQLVALCLGVVGTIIAAVSSGLPNWLAALTPWGYYSLAAAADYRDTGLVTLTPAYGPIAALTILAAIAFIALTHRLDSQEV